MISTFLNDVFYFLTARVCASKLDMQFFCLSVFVLPFKQSYLILKAAFLIVLFPPPVNPNSRANRHPNSDTSDDQFSHPPASFRFKL